MIFSLLLRLESSWFDAIFDSRKTQFQQEEFLAEIFSLCLLVRLCLAVLLQAVVLQVLLQAVILQFISSLLLLHKRLFLQQELVTLFVEDRIVLDFLKPYWWR